MSTNCICCLFCTVCRKGDLDKTTLFNNNEVFPVYRIPALIYNNDSKTFLAFAEKRKSSDDVDAELLVMRRGTFQYCSLQWSPPEELKKARLKGYRTMNPCPVYEKESKTLFLFFICVKYKITEADQKHRGKNEARLCYIKSSDNGLKWSDVQDLTESVIGDEIKNWATFAVGPGHGIQTTSGRLIVPGYTYYITRKPDSPNSKFSLKCQSFAFYSDDHGKIWKRGGRVETPSVECQMAEIIDRDCKSHLYCNARSEKHHRVEAVSTNGGETFDESDMANVLVETGSGCQGSVVSFPAPEQQHPDTKTWLAYSHPTNKENRKDLGVYVNKSPLNSSGWKNPWVIHRGPSGYSDLIYCEDTGKFACVMECGVKSELEQIAFVMFSRDELINKF